MNPTRVWSSFLALLVSSGIVVIQGASDEPYLSFQPSDAFVQIGGSAILVVLWGQWCVGTSSLIRRGVISKGWWSLMLFATASVLALIDGAVGYAADIERLGIELRAAVDSAIPGAS